MSISNWEYENEPGFSDQLLANRAEQVLSFLAGLGPRDLSLLIRDTRRVHLFYFNGLTPEGAPYFAGNYRGSNFPGLKNYHVQMGGVNGTDPRFVDIQMAKFADHVQRLTAQFELIWVDQARSDAEKLFKLAELAATIFVVFLTIHPYANGNGHISRYILIAMFRIYGFKPGKLIVHPRPRTTPPLEVLINSFRANDRRPLTLFLLSTLTLVV